MSTSSWPSTFIWCCITLWYRIWSRTAGSSQTLVDADCDLRMSTFALSQHTRTHFGDRSFLVGSLPQLWNSLPVELHQPHVETGQFSSLGGFWKRFCLSETAPLKPTYLLTFSSIVNAMYSTMQLNFKCIIIIIIIINDIYRAQTSPRSKCAKSAVARLQLS